MVVHRQMKGQGLQHMLILGKSLRPWGMEILPGFELVDDHNESVKAMILRQLTIDVGEATADVPAKRDLDVNRSRRFDDSFGKRLWHSLFASRSSGVGRP
jgi:hypothetical protein